MEDDDPKIIVISVSYEIICDYLVLFRSTKQKYAKHLSFCRVVVSFTSICVRDEARRVGWKTKIDLFDDRFTYGVYVSFLRHEVNGSHPIDFLIKDLHIWSTRIVVCLKNPCALTIGLLKVVKWIFMLLLSISSSWLISALLPSDLLLHHQTTHTHISIFTSTLQWRQLNPCYRLQIVISYSLIVGLKRHLFVYSFWVRILKHEMSLFDFFVRYLT